MNRLACLFSIVSCAAASPAARAQDLPRAAVLSPAIQDEADAGLASALERVLRARLDALDVVEVEGTPALNLPDLQLAVGCVAETDACLAAVARQLEVDALVIPTIDRAGDALVASVEYFVAEGAETRRAVRRAEGERAPNELLAQVDPMVRELFDLPPPEEPIEPEELGIDPDPGDGQARREPPPAPEPPPEEGVSPVPFVVGGAGLAAVAGGVVFGLLSESSEGDWSDAPKNTMAQVDAAHELRERAEAQALVANVLLGVGGAAVVAGAALFVLELDGGDEEPPPGGVAVAPWLSPGAAGVVATGRFGGAP